MFKERQNPANPANPAQWSHTAHISAAVSHTNNHSHGAEGPGPYGKSV